jgi:phage shock protein A
MDILKQYLERAAEIIGERTSDEERYDREVVRWLEKGKPIQKAIAKANEKFPKEALQVDDSLLADVTARYEYLLEHERIMRRLQR